MVSGGKIADYLTSEDKNAVLEQLVAPETPVAEEKAAVAEAAPAKDINVELEKLTDEVKAAPVGQPAAPAEQSADMAAADARLNDLLGAPEKEK